jgi:hypothetical protein
MLTQKVDKIRHVPFFGNLTRVALMKYQNYFEEANHCKGSILQKEGTDMTHLHLILEGEFEVTRSIKYID